VARDLPGQRIQTLNRRGKYLQFALSGGQTLFIHLKMSGDLLVEPVTTPRHPHVRTIFVLDNHYELRFKDPRKFGRVHLTRDPMQVTGHLGPEPLSDTFTLERFKELFKNRRGRLKPLLMDQRFIAGIGNIYAAESCFAAGVHPRRAADTLTQTELEHLYYHIRRQLQRGITLKGASLDAVYRGGEFQNEFKVYGRQGQPCLQCGAPIQRIMLGGRSTFFCPVCQPE
jgi:formamidopyrimidine-DNA glycosylase